MVSIAADHRVAIVLDESFPTGELYKLAQTMHVWLIESRENRENATSFWCRYQGSEDDPLVDGITTFRSQNSATPEETLVAIVDEVDMHHGEHAHDPPLNELHIYGVNLTRELQDALGAYGFKKFRAIDRVCFIAKR